MAAAAQQQALASLKGFLESGAYSDLTITCKDDTYKVHKVIVCGRADFFARTLKFGGKESRSGVIDLPEDDPAIVKLIIQYLYEGEYAPLLPDGESSLAPTSVDVKKSRPAYNDKGQIYSYDFPHTCSRPNGYCNSYTICPHHTCRHLSSAGYCVMGSCNAACSKFNCEKCNPPAPALPPPDGTSEQLLLHAQMYEYADKYDVVGLKDLAIEKFSRSCKHFWNNDKFAVATHHVFSTTIDTDKGLRDIVSATISAHMELVKKPEVKVLMTEFNGLALGVLEQKIIENGW